MNTPGYILFIFSIFLLEVNVFCYIGRNWRAREACHLLKRCSRTKVTNKSLKKDNLVRLIGNISSGLFTSHVGLIYENKRNEELVSLVNKHLFHLEISAVVYNMKNDKNETARFSKVTDELKARTLKYMPGAYIFYVNPETAEDIIEMIASESFARRNIIYIFIWIGSKITLKFYNSLQEVMRVCVIIERKHDVFQMFYNQAEPDGRNRLRLINWWTSRKGLFYRPLLPIQEKVYNNLQGRILHIPVLHKPPWHFVIYGNDSIEVAGGRDDKLLQLLSRKLNFGFEYFDPVDKSQGSALVNGTMQGVLGLIWQKEAELFIGDLTITYERSLAVEFSFPTLADSEAFLTHAPGRLNEALALVRPFALDVWPAVIATMVLSGPALYLFSLHSNNSKPSLKVFIDYIWVIISIFLKQSLINQYKGTRVRLTIILLYLVSTYVIGDMYSANLTSMLARPAREKPVSNLEQLNDAMKYRGYKLLVEKHSASHAVFENGTGLYKSIWEKMKRQSLYLLDSTEEGMPLVRNDTRIALIGGRETFYYDTRRFGAHHFHLSEKLYTRYSAIALQIGCPFIKNFNAILIRLFEAGVLAKITEDEYEKLKGRQSSSYNQKEDEVSEGQLQVENDYELKAMSMTSLQGAFYIVGAGSFLGGISLALEITYGVIRKVMNKGRSSPKLAQNKTTR